MKINKFKFLPILLLAPISFGTINTTVSCNKVLSYRVRAPYDTGAMIKDTDYTKVYIIAGQSNAVGCCETEQLKKKVPTEDFNQYHAGFNKVQIATCNNDVLPQSPNFAPTNCYQGASGICFGPELGFAEVMSKRSNNNLYIIKYAYGGTCLDTQWLNGSGARGQLYTNMINFFKTEINLVQNPKLCGVCWMQGESDASKPYSGRYYDNTNKLVTYIKEDLKDYIAPGGLTFVDAGISKHWSRYDEINGAKINFWKTSKLNGYFSTTENGLETRKDAGEADDNAHYCALSQLQLGKWFALKTIELFNSNN